MHSHEIMALAATKLVRERRINVDLWSIGKDRVSKTEMFNCLIENTPALMKLVSEEISRMQEHGFTVVKHEAGYVKFKHEDVKSRMERVQCFPIPYCRLVAQAELPVGEHKHWNGVSCETTNPSEYADWLENAKKTVQLRVPQYTHCLSLVDQVLEEFQALDVSADYRDEHYQYYDENKEPVETIRVTQDALLAVLGLDWNETIKGICADFTQCCPSSASAVGVLAPAPVIKDGKILYNGYVAYLTCVNSKGESNITAIPFLAFILPKIVLGDIGFKVEFTEESVNVQYDKEMYRFFIHHFHKKFSEVNNVNLLTRQDGCADNTSAQGS